MQQSIASGVSLLAAGVERLICENAKGSSSVGEEDSDTEKPVMIVITGDKSTFQNSITTMLANIISATTPELTDVFNVVYAESMEEAKGIVEGGVGGVVGGRGKPEIMAEKIKEVSERSER